MGFMALLRFTRPFALPLLFLACADGFAQTSTQNSATPTHDPAAVAAIQNAIAALGGERAAAAIKDTAITADCEKKVHETTETHKLRVIASGEYFRADTGEGDSRPAQSGPDGRSVVINNKVVPLSDRHARAFRQFHFPLAVLREDMKPDKTDIELLPDAVIDGRAVTHVVIADIKASQRAIEPVADEWFFDKTTGLPVRVTYQMQGVGSLRRFIEVSVEYADFQRDQASRTLVPMTFRRRYEGGASRTCKLSSFAVNQSPSDQTFMRNGGTNE